MTNAGFLVIADVVRNGLAGRPPWWLVVYQIVCGWQQYEADRRGEVQTWVPAILRELEKLGVRTRQGTLPCDKSVRRALEHLRAMKWLAGDGKVNRARRCIQVTVQLTLSALLTGKKRECPSGVSKWFNRRSTGLKPVLAGPVSKSSVQGFQDGSSFFKETPVDNSALAAWRKQGGPVTPEILQAMYGR